MEVVPILVVTRCGEGVAERRPRFTGGEEANNLKQRVLERSVMVTESPQKKTVVLLRTATVT